MGKSNMEMVKSERRIEKDGVSVSDRLIRKAKQMQ